MTKYQTSNSIPTYAVSRNGMPVGFVRAVSMKQAIARAKARYGRCEVYGLAVNDADRAIDSYSHNKRPCDVGDYDARRDREIAEWKARNC